ncbi:MAG: hypothetical protein U5S82_15430 [Gammaproteobacteria bacterium]|nr:hypothetical protein [Gammaproteobacteria bacterium]
MSNRKIIPLIFCAMLAGCAAPKYNYRPVALEVSEPPIGSMNTAYVGDILLKQGSYTEHDSIYLQEDQKVGWAYTVLRGFYLKHGDDEATAFYKPAPGSDGGGVDKAALADPWKSIQAYKEEQKLCVVTAFNAQICKDKADFTRQKKPVLRDDSFQQTLIYSGKVGNKINIGYREFSGNMARPAFNNDVEYDLGASNTIGYKGAKLEIVEATNELIKYRIIRNFNAAKFSPN